MSVTNTPLYENIRSAHRTIMLVLLGAVITCALTASWVLTFSNIFLSIHLSVMTLLFTLVVSLEWRRNERLPLLVSPGMAILASIAFGSVAAFQFSADDYNSYLQLWILQGLGVVVGLFLTQTPVVGISSKNSFTRAGAVTLLSQAICIVGFISAVLFFAVYGIPALSGNIEQGRVDAAAEGTGYLRLVAYLMIPASLLMIAVRASYRWVWFILTLAVVLGLANRSPLVYLLVPLLFIAFSRNKIRLTSFRILLAAAIVLAGVAGVGALRIFSQDEFTKYDEYRDDLAEGDFIGVAMTSLTHYSAVVADNAVLSKNLIDSGALEHKWGGSYLTLFISALPGEQLSLDRVIKATTGKTFIGGGTPPTLMGEGYINFGPAGTVAGAAGIVILTRLWGDRYARAGVARGSINDGVLALIYGYVLTWACLSQVAGLAGASTFPLAGALTLWLVWRVSQTEQLPEGGTP